jgi:hypothetical protein
MYVIGLKIIKNDNLDISIPCYLKYFQVHKNKALLFSYFMATSDQHPPMHYFGWMLVR